MLILVALLANATSNQSYFCSSKNFDKVMRAKGVLAISGYDAKFAFQAVHVAFDGTVALASKWGKDERRFSEVVIIGFEVRADLIEHGLKRCRA